MLSSPRPPPFVRVRTHEWHFSVVQNLNRNIFHFHQKSTTIYNFFFWQQQECSIGMMKNSWSIARRMKSNESFQKGNKREILNLIAFLSAYGSMCVCACASEKKRNRCKNVLFMITPIFVPNTIVCHILAYYKIGLTPSRYNKSSLVFDTKKGVSNRLAFFCSPKCQQHNFVNECNESPLSIELSK